MKVAIFGMGTVGSGVVKVLQGYLSRQEALKTPSALRLTHVFANEIRDKSLDLTGVSITNDIEEIFQAQPDVIVEVLGGVDLAYQVHQKALAQGIHVVTANKDLLALHMDHLMALGNQHHAQVHYEAACGGGIPIVGPLQYDLVANQITEIKGILNGTSNYILTRMTQEGVTYEEVLAQAQALGYAEKDPTNDVQGYDACRKLAILSRLAYLGAVDYQAIHTRGIDQVQGIDLRLASQKGYTLKLIAWSRFEGESLAMSVEPVLLPHAHLLSHIHMAKNAVYVQGSAVGQAMFYGPGAGSLETASAVVSDLIDLEKVGYRGNLQVGKSYPITKAQHDRAYYLRPQANQIQALENLLTHMAVGFETVSEVDNKAVFTQAISPQDIQAIQAQISLAAWYPVEVD
ncbi:TPA: homoserine dehydrogenase [Streptococcus suis]